MIEYHNVGDIGNLVISHSAINTIDPQMGGHPSKFLAFFQDTKDRPYTPSMERGDLLHLWMEREDSFAISELDAPTEQMGRFSQSFYDLYFKEEYKLREGITDKVQISFDDCFKINEIYSSLFGQKATEEQFNLITSCIFLARKEAQVDKRLLNGTILEKFETICLPYLRFLKSASGKIITSKQTKEILVNCHNSILAHPTAKKLIALPGEKEKEFYWEENINGVVIKRKAKVDQIYFDSKTGILYIIDYKTTALPVSSFASLNGSYYKYKLGRQLVNYESAFLHSSEIIPTRIEHYNIVVQTTENYPTIVYKTSFTTAHAYRQDLQDMLKRISYHIGENKWDMTMEEYKNEYIEI